jgi:hypothetical protein
VLEAAGGQHHTTARVCLERAVRPLDERAGHAVVAGQQAYAAATGLRYDPAVEASLEQAADQGLPRAALVADLPSG